MKDTINIGDTKEMLCEMLAIPSVSGPPVKLSASFQAHTWMSLHSAGARK